MLIDATNATPLLTLVVRFLRYAATHLPGVSWPFNCRKKLRVTIVLEVMRCDPNHSERVRELLTDPDHQMEGMFKGITGLGQVYRRQRETVLSIFMPCQSWNPRWSHLEC
jgi:hypothetical protein